MPGNVRAGLEAEVAVGLTPTEFAARAGTEVSAAEARGALRQLGVQVPEAIRDVEAANAALRDLPKLTKEQIQHFLNLIR